MESTKCHSFVLIRSNRWIRNSTRLQTFILKESNCKLSNNTFNSLGKRIEYQCGDMKQDPFCWLWPLYMRACMDYRRHLWPNDWSIHWHYTITFSEFEHHSLLYLLILINTNRNSLVREWNHSHMLTIGSKPTLERDWITSWSNKVGSESLLVIGLFLVQEKLTISYIIMHTWHTCR